MSGINAEAVAAELGISYDLFMRTRKDLEKRGLPPPLPLASRPLRMKESEPLRARQKRGRPPLRWSLDAIRDWIRNPAPPRALPEISDAHAARILRIPTRDRDALARRLG